MKTEQNKMTSLAVAQMMKDHQETYLVRMELMSMVAVEIKGKYDALLAAGFTPEQALELCKAKAI